jgi:hypothetical protein
MKKVISILIVFTSTICFSQKGCDPCKYPFVSKTEELKCFVENVATWLIDGIYESEEADYQRFAIYVLNIVEIDTLELSVSMSVCYVLNRSDVDYVNYTNYLKTEERSVLITSKKYSQFLENEFGFPSIHNSLPDELYLKLKDDITNPLLSYGYALKYYYIDYSNGYIRIKPERNEMKIHPKYRIFEIDDSFFDNVITVPFDSISIKKSELGL